MEEAKRYMTDSYRISVGALYEGDVQYYIHQLIRSEEEAKRFIAEQQNKLGSYNSIIAGTLFAKRYSVLAIVFFHIWNTYGFLLRVKPAGTGIQLMKDGFIRILLLDPAFHNVSELSPSEINNILYTFLFEHISPLFQSISRASGCKEAHMYSLVSHNIHQTALQLKRAHPEKKAQCETNLNMILSDVLGKTNPLPSNFRLQTFTGGESFYVRKHCCLKYVLYGRDKSRCCGTCPLIWN